jgi:peroxiredoxin
LSPDRQSPDAQADGEQARRAGRPYSVAVGVVFLIAVLVAGVNSLNNSGSGVRGLTDGNPLPRFAAPTATGSLDGDANINRTNRTASGKPRTAACQVPGSARDVVRICDYFDRPIVLVAWFTRGCSHCRPQLDTVESVRKAFPQVQFIGLDIADSLHNARKEVRQHGWGFPMAVDRDGAVSALYGVGVGPTTVFAYPGGIVMGTAFGELDREQLTVRLRRLLRAAEHRGLYP